MSDPSQIFEGILKRSYNKILSRFMSDPSQIFEEILKRSYNQILSRIYQDLLKNSCQDFFDSIN